MRGLKQAGRGTWLRGRRLAAVGTIALTAVFPVAAQGQVYNFDLNGSLQNNGSGSGTLTNNGATQGATGLTFGVNQGPTLTGATPLTNYTIDLLFSFDSLQGYRKIVDFQNLGSDAGLYNLSGRLGFFGQGQNFGPTTSITAGDPVRVTFSRDVLGNAIGYVNGVQQFSFTDTAGQALFGSTINFFRDDNGGLEASRGFVDYIRVFDRVLTPEQAVVTAPQPGAVPEPATWAMMIVGFGSAGFAMRRRKRTVGPAPAVA